MSINKVRVMVTDSMGRKQVYEDTVVPTERTPSIAAHDMINAIVLRDGDTLSVEFLSVPA